MKTLDDAWQWYEKTRFLLKGMRRLAERYWNDLPWDGALGRDNVLGDVADTRLIEAADSGIAELDDLAIVGLFSAFEATVRERLRTEVEEEKQTITHPVLMFASEEALRDIHRGSFAKVLQSLKHTDHHLVEQVRQIRRYRNWVSHGRRGEAPFILSPRSAYDRLSSTCAVFGAASTVA
jgi:hypothetical protein